MGVAVNSDSRWSERVRRKPRDVEVAAPHADHGVRALGVVGLVAEGGFADRLVMMNGRQGVEEDPPGEAYRGAGIRHTLTVGDARSAADRGPGEVFDPTQGLLVIAHDTLAFQRIRGTFCAKSIVPLWHTRNT